MGHQSTIIDHRLPQGIVDPTGGAAWGADNNIPQAIGSGAALPVHRWHGADIRAFIAACLDRDTLIKVLLGYADRWLTNRLIVTFVKGKITPYMVEAWPRLSRAFNDVEALRQIAVDPGRHWGPGDRSPWRKGTAKELGLAPLFAALGVSGPDRCIFCPVAIGGRMAMGLIGVPRIGSAAVPLQEVDDDLQGLVDATDWVGQQLEEVILRAKVGTLPPRSARIPCLPTPSMPLREGATQSLGGQTRAPAHQDSKDHRWTTLDDGPPPSRAAGDDQSLGGDEYSDVDRAWSDILSDLCESEAFDQDPPMKQTMADDSHRSGPRPLTIPTDRRGVPMAQILRRPNKGCHHRHGGRSLGLKS